MLRCLLWLSLIVIYVVVAAVVAIPNPKMESIQQESLLAFCLVAAIEADD